MRVIFLGTADFAVPSLERLLADRHAVVRCITQPDRPQGRGLRRAPSPVKRAAIRLSVPLAQPDRVSRHVLASLQPDVGVVVAYGQLLPEDVLTLPPYGMVGVHPSLLPQYRGAAPVAWALLNGEMTTGVTIFRLNERLDAGEIIGQRAIPIESGEEAEHLSERLAHLGAQALSETLETMAAGRARFTPQNEARASFAPKLTKAQGCIEWGASAKTIERLVRATAPWPGAMTSWQGKSLKICKVSLGEALGAGNQGPGTVVRVDQDALTVATGRGTLVIRDIQPAGRRRMSVREFLAGHPMHVGERFGTGDTG